MDWIREALHPLGDIVKSSQEFSLCDSLDRLKEYAPVNPVFEHTLEGNAENSYCRTYIAELFDATLFHGSDAPYSRGLRLTMSPMDLFFIRKTEN